MSLINALLGASPRKSPAVQEIITRSTLEGEKPQVIEIRENRTIQAVKVCSHVLGDEVWLILDHSFTPQDGLAAYYAEEIPLLRNRTQEELREIHNYKLAYPAARLIQDGPSGENLTAPKILR